MTERGYGDTICDTGAQDCYAGNGMADKRQVVNLDALIERADLFETPGQATLSEEPIRISDLAGPIYRLLRKPDFQRETANWTPQQVCDLIETFSKSDIIPSIILWHNRDHIFVVDGAHRLSALAAWVQDDYGAGKRSLGIFGPKIPDAQTAMHDATRDLVNRTVGPWTTFQKNNAVQTMKALDVQWIRSSGATQAAAAFIRINRGGTVIDSLEERILNARRTALGISTRVVARGGTGHKYWNHFTDTNAARMTPRLGADIYKLLFHPTLELPVKTNDVPLAGHGYGSHAVRFAFDLIAVSNSLAVADSTRKKEPADGVPVDDTTGNETIQYLQNTKRAVQLLLSSEPLSLGLHPLLYFYTSGGHFQAASLLNTLVWVLDLEKRGKLDAFRKVRRQFETLLIKHPVIVKPAAHKLGSGGRTRNRTIALFDALLKILADDRNVENAWRRITRKHEFKYLLTDEKEHNEDLRTGKAGNKQSRTAKSAGYLREALPRIQKCRLCGGLMHRNGMSSDHKRERSEGGSSAADNARMVHPICNSNRKKDRDRAKKR